MKITNTQAQQAAQAWSGQAGGQLAPELTENLVEPQVILRTDLPQDQHWRFIELNTTRALRGKEAARVEVDAGGRWLWMSRQNVIDNIRDFGDHPELQKALKAYEAWN